MEATRSLSELRQYLDKFKEDMASIDIEDFEKIPKFTIPNWPKAAGEISVTVRSRKVMYPVAGRESGNTNLRKRFFLPVYRILYFIISTKGEITIEYEHRGHTYSFASNSEVQKNRTWCFIIFSQLLDPLCRKIIKRLKKRYQKYKIEIEEYNKVCEAVKKSFEPLIPFIVADILSEEGP